MGKRRKKGHDRRVKGLIILVVIVVGVAGGLFYHHIRQYKNLGTYSFAGMLYPVMPGTYTKVSSSTSNGSDVGYLTGNSIAQIETDVANICKSNKFTLQQNSLSPGQTSSAAGPTFDVYGINCDSKNNTWLFGIITAAALQYEPWKDGVPAAALKTSLSGKYWVDISSNGPPLCVEPNNSSRPCQ